MSPDEAEDKASAFAERVLRRHFAVGFASLSEQDKRFYCVYKVELEVKNGGLFQFLANTGPEALVVESAYVQVFKGAFPRTEAEHDRRLAVIAEEDLRATLWPARPRRYVAGRRATDRSEARLLGQVPATERSGLTPPPA